MSLEVNRYRLGMAQAKEWAQCEIAKYLLCEKCQHLESLFGKFGNAETDVAHKFLSDSCYLFVCQKPMDNDNLNFI